MATRTSNVCKRAGYCKSAPFSTTWELELHHLFCIPRETDPDLKPRLRAHDVIKDLITGEVQSPGQIRCPSCQQPFANRTGFSQHQKGWTCPLFRTRNQEAVQILQRHNIRIPSPLRDKEFSAVSKTPRQGSPAARIKSPTVTAGGSTGSSKPGDPPQEVALKCKNALNSYHPCDKIFSSACMKEIHEIYCDLPATVLAASQRPGAERDFLSYAGGTQIKRCDECTKVFLGGNTANHAGSAVCETLAVAKGRAVGVWLQHRQTVGLPYSQVSSERGRSLIRGQTPPAKTRPARQPITMSPKALDMTSNHSRIQSRSASAESLTGARQGKRRASSTRSATSVPPLQRHKVTGSASLSGAATSSGNIQRGTSVREKSPLRSMTSNSPQTMVPQPPPAASTPRFAGTHFRPW